MPYITQDRRLRTEPVVMGEIQTPGELNFAITRLVMKTLKNLPPNYDSYNAVIGVLESAKLEFYRRVMIPYENKKREENGDVY